MRYGSIERQDEDLEAKLLREGLDEGELARYRDRVARRDSFRGAGIRCGGARHAGCGGVMYWFETPSADRAPGTRAPARAIIPVVAPGGTQSNRLVSLSSDVSAETSEHGFAE